VEQPLKRLGVFGGTFDPPHIGHLLLAETARIALDLEQILFLPVGDPPHKNGCDVSPAHHRLAMTRLAIADNPAFVLDTTDIDRPAPHYTATLLPIIQSQYPQADLWLVLGSDSLQDLPNWHYPHDLLAQCRLAVLERPGVRLDWSALDRMLPELRDRLDWLTGPSMLISATMVRQFAAAGRSLRYLITEPVHQYITQHHLYPRR